jgi:predicted Na+-dependent transporter
VFIVWLIGLLLAVLAPVVLAIAITRLFRADERAGALRVLAGGAIGAVVGFFFSTIVEFVAERSVTDLGDYWWAQAAAGFTVGAVVALAIRAARLARARAAELL